MTKLFCRTCLVLSKVASLWLLIGVAVGQAVAATPSATSLSNKQQLANCSFAINDNWWQSSYQSVPGSIANNPVTKENEFCEFYQFAQDWFLYLISPSSIKGLANWEDPTQYPLLETGGTNSCDDDHATQALHIRAAKAGDAKGDHILPERIDQAGFDVHAIYDQNGNVVFYEVRFSRNLCDYKKIQEKLNFPGKTVELKLAWRVLGANESQKVKNSYYQTNASINGVDYVLGLVGWHIVVTADNHPEMVWITLERNDNAVDCQSISAGQQGYSFTSQACASGSAACNNLNKSLNSKAISLPSGQAAYDICDEFPYGTVEGQSIDTDDGLNIALIEKLNKAMPLAYRQSGMPSELSIWSNYKFKGALWVSDITEKSKSANQRGSLELANTVLETTFQGTSGSAGSSLNCFGCHAYNGNGESNTGYQKFLSHTFDDVINGQCDSSVQAVQVINNQSQASAVCTQTCSATSTTKSWNGQWTNQDASGKQLPMTVCGCCPSQIVQ